MHESENNKTDGKGKHQLKIQPSQQASNQLAMRSVGVGDYPIKQPIMQWTAIFMEGKYYLADPLSIQRLQQIQSQIQLQKKLAEQNQIERAESVKQAVIQREECSFATEFNHNRQVKNDSKVNKQLQRQEQLVAQRLAHKKEGKKVKKNMIKINGKEDLKSEKEKAEKQKEEQLENKSLANQPHPNNKQSLQSIVQVENIEKPKQVPKLEKVESIANEPVYQRAGNSFFDRLDNNILELEDHIDQIQHFNQPILDNSVATSNAQMKQSHQKSLQLQPQNQKSNDDFLNKAQILSYGDQQSHKSSINDQLLKELGTGNDQPQLQVIDFYKKKTVKLTVAQGIFNYQISLPPVANLQNVAAQKQLLNSQINLLKQAIGQLRVERLKYHMNQSQRLNQQENETNPPSNYHRSIKEGHNGPFSQGQSNEGHHVIESVLNNFTESIVSEFVGTPQKKLVRTLSGKIIKNVAVKAPQKQVIALKQEPINIQQTLSNELSQKIAISIGQEAIALASQNRSKNRMTDSEELAALQVSIQSKVFGLSPKKQAKQEIEPMKVEKKDDTNIIIPLAIKVEPTESEMESSMPRPLSKNVRSQAPNFIVKEVPRKQENNKSNKKILGNFDHLSKLSTPPVIQSQIDPKRRAAKDGFIKTIQAKIAQNTSGKPLGHESTFKQKIFNIEQMRKSNGMGYGSEATKGNSQVKGYRLRRQSQTSRNSRVSHSVQSHKSCGCSKNTQAINGVYVPALSRAQHEKNSSKQEDHPIYEMEITEKKHSHSPSQKKIELKNRDKAFSKLQMPVLPEPPSTDITVDEMVLLLKRMDTVMGLRLGEGELHRLVMKKYKNCIMFDLANSKNHKIVWHYSGKLYIGEWDEVEMFKSGKGEEYVPQKYYYKGGFQSGKRSGKGSLIQTNGNRYEGQWLNGQKHGSGKYYDSTLKLFYQGEWISGKRQGNGYLEIEQQSKYQGAFLNNYRHGLGKEIFFNGDSYQGNYQKGKFHGLGTYKWASGARYEGDFFEGCKHGQGKWISENGDNYAGQYRQDKKSGQGQYAWANGCIYEGEFSQDKKDGKGVLIYADGRRMTGIWKDGQLINTIQQTDGPEEPLAYKKSRAYQTTTVFKVVDSVASKLNTPNKMSPF